jgi:hypothetical protein
MQNILSHTIRRFLHKDPSRAGSLASFVSSLLILLPLILQACAVNLNNPQVGQSGFISPIDNSNTPSTEGEETFMPSGHVRILPSTDRTQINASITFTAEGGTLPYLFNLNDGSGVLDPISGAFTAPATPGFAIVEVKDEVGSNDRATVLFKDPPLFGPSPEVRKKTPHNLRHNPIPAHLGPPWGGVKAVCNGMTPLCFKTASS